MSNISQWQVVDLEPSGVDWPWLTNGPQWIPTGTSALHNQMAGIKWKATVRHLGRFSGSVHLWLQWDGNDIEHNIYCILMDLSWFKWTNWYSIARYTKCAQINILIHFISFYNSNIYIYIHIYNDHISQIPRGTIQGHPPLRWRRTATEKPPTLYASSPWLRRLRSGAVMIWWRIFGRKKNVGQVTRMIFLNNHWPLV